MLRITATRQSHLASSAFSVQGANFAALLCINDLPTVQINQ